MVHLSSKGRETSDQDGKPKGYDDGIWDIERWENEGGRHVRTRPVLIRGYADFGYYFL